MKKLILIYTALAVMFYLITAFICGTFNPAEMDVVVKAIAGVFYLIGNSLATISIDTEK